MAQNNLVRWNREFSKKNRAKSTRELEQVKQRLNALEDDNTFDSIGIDSSSNQGTSWMARIFNAGKDVEDVNGILIGYIAETGVEFRDGDFLLDKQAPASIANTKLYVFHNNQWNEILGGGGTIIVDNYSDLPTGPDYYGRIGFTTVSPLNVGWMNVISDGQLPSREWVSITHITDPRVPLP